MAASSIPWTRLKALSFDIYGTLIDWESGIAQAARNTALGPHLPETHQALMLAIEKHDTAVQREHPTMLQSDVVAEGLRRYADELQLVARGHLTTEQVDRAARHYGAQIGTYPAFADTVAAVQALGTRYRLVPLSNVDRASFARTLEGPLAGCRFDRCYVAEDIGSYKPDVRNFRYLLDHVREDLGVEREELCHVAQSLFHDHGPAQQVGLQSVWVDRKGFMGAMGETGEDWRKIQDRFGFKLRVETLRELADIVERAWSREGVQGES
jgi:2-haloalkanoic acid dehalogenase type II